ncbi:MAG: DUF1786 domain-containing protein [Methermicoccaceae archaeon]
MRLVAIDIGMGTQDVLVYDTEKRVENCTKMVLPSPTLLKARKVRSARAEGRDVLLEGGVMGGGHISRAVKEHIRAGLSVYATRAAALTLKDDLERVKQMGVCVVDGREDVPESALSVSLCDVDMEMLEQLLSCIDEDVPEVVGVAVQDHGFSLGSNRQFRFEHLRRIIQSGGTLEHFAYMDDVPEHLTRMRQVCEDVHPRTCFVMDTGPSAIFGCLVEGQDEPCVVVNVGNGHVLAAAVIDGKVVSIFEHHTRLVDAAKLDGLIRKLCEGTLTHEQVFYDGGHGAYVDEPIGDVSVLATGPNRHIMRDSKLDVQFPAPFGDMMLTGCFGLLAAARALGLGVELDWLD